VVQAPADYVEAGSACAELIANPKGWINRRVETVEMLAQEETRRRVSIDFTLSAQQRDRLRTRHGLTVPISVLSKRPLRNFDLRDEDDGARPILGRADNRTLALTALLSASLDALGDPRQDDRVDSLTADLRQIVFDDGEPALEGLAAFVDAAESGDEMRAAVWKDPACRSMLRTLATDYVLFAALPLNGPDRRVIKYSYGEDFPLGPPPWARLSDRYAPSEVLWRARYPDRTWFLIDCPAAWRAASFHMEIAIPEDLRIARAELGRFPLGDGGEDGDGEDGDEPIADLGEPDKDVNRAALYAATAIEPHDDVRAYVEIYSEREGPATRAALTAIAVAALLWLGYLSGLDASAPGAAVSLLLAGGAVVSGFAAVTGFHIIVNKILRSRRRALVLVVVCALTASASLAMEVPDRRPLEIWLVAAILCSLAALRLGWSAVRAAR
jgi:hypothetical protein